MDPLINFTRAFFLYDNASFSFLFLHFDLNHFLIKLLIVDFSQFLVLLIHCYFNFLFNYLPRSLTEKKKIQKIHLMIKNQIHAAFAHTFLIHFYKFIISYDNFIWSKLNYINSFWATWTINNKKWIRKVWAKAAWIWFLIIRWIFCIFFFSVKLLGR